MSVNPTTKSIFTQYFLTKFKKMPRTLKEIKRLEKLNSDNKPDSENGSLVKIAEGASYYDTLPTNSDRAMSHYLSLRDRVTLEQATFVKPFELRKDGMTQNDVDKSIAEGLIRSQNGLVVLQDYELFMSYLNFFADLVEEGIIRVSEGAKKETWLIAPINHKGASKGMNKIKILDEMFKSNFQKYFSLDTK